MPQQNYKPDLSILDMVNLKIFSFLVLFISLIGLLSAATCAQKSYSASCLKCTFDKSGKMDQKCYQSYQDKGVQCLFVAYPIESIQYKLGNCPAIDVCVDRLEECKGLYTIANDKADCQFTAINHCFVKADACVAKAIKNCTGTPPGDLENDLPPASFCDGFIAVFIALFSGIGIFRTKQESS